jgi:signal transduction histidine kinase
MALQLLRPHVDNDGEELLAETEQELQQALAELRELARGIHPAVLTDQGLDAAVRTLAGRAPIPVTVTSDSERLRAHVETAAYFVVAESLTNAGKHAGGDARATVTIRDSDHALHIQVSDDGDGGADPAGSGLTGLRHRVEALDGSLTVLSEDGAGTTIRARLPYVG